MRNYLDKFWFRLILTIVLSLFVTEIGSMYSLATRLRTSDFYKEYLATVLISIVVVEVVYFVNSRLDRNVPWQGQVIYRLFLQAVFGWLAPLFLVFALAAFYFHMYSVDIRETDYVYYAFPIVMLLLLFLNLLLVMTPYFLLGFQYIKNNQGEMQHQIQQPQTLKRIKIEDGKSIMMLEPKQIKGAYVVNKKVVLRNSKDEEVLTDLTLDELEKEYLPPDSFFRINRQLIASRANCIEYKPLDYGKLEIQLSIPVPVDTIVSQLKAKAFKEWIID